MIESTNLFYSLMTQFHSPFSE